MAKSKLSESQRIEIFVTYFLITGLTVMVVLVILLIVSAKFTFFKNNYIIYYKYGNDISKGTQVTLNGINIGKVTGLDIDEENRIKIMIQITKKYQNKIRRNSVARIVRPLLIGNKQISITPGTAEFPVIPPNHEIPSQESTELIDLISGLNIKSVFDNMGIDFKKFLESLLEDGNINIQEFYQIVMDSFISFNEFQKALKDMNKSIVTLEKGMSGIGNNMESIGTGMNKIGNNMGGLGTGMEKIDSNFNNITKAMKDMNQNMKSIIQSFNSMNQNLKNMEPALKKLPGVLEETEILIKAMKNSWLLKGEVKKIRNNQ